MTISQVLEVAIGLVLVYYLLGSIVSWMTRTLLEAQETRGKTLEEYLKKIAGKKTVDLTNLPQMKALQPIRYKSGLSMFLGRQPQAAMIEKIPVATLVDAFFDISGLTGTPLVDGESLKMHLNQLPPSEGRDAMIKWVEQGVSNVNGLRSRASSYFTGLLDQAASTFKANARRIVILLSIAVTLFFGTDSIQLGKDLWTNAELRAITAVQADMIAQGNENLDLQTILAELDKLSIVKFGWWHITDALPDTAQTSDWLAFIGLKLIGLAITAAAVSQGSSFWYDLLKKLTSPSKSGGGGSSGGGAGDSEAKG